MIEEEGKVSYAYRKEAARPAFAFQQQKNSTQDIEYITVIYPFSGNKPPKVKAAFVSKAAKQLEVTINKKKHLIEIE